MSSPRNVKKRKLQVPSPSDLALQWLDEYIKKNREPAKTSRENKPRFPMGTWIFDDGDNGVVRVVSKGLLLKKFKTKQGEYFVRHENGEIEKIITIKRWNDRRADAYMQRPPTKVPGPDQLVEDFIADLRGISATESPEQKREIDAFVASLFRDEEMFSLRKRSVFAEPYLTLFSPAPPENLAYCLWNTSTALDLLQENRTLSRERSTRESAKGEGRARNSLRT